MRSLGRVALLAAMAMSFAHDRTAAQTMCVGDCNDDGTVLVNDLIIGVNISLGDQPLSACPSFDCDGAGVQINCLIIGVNNALEGCPATPTPPNTATATPLDTATSTPLNTATATLASTATATPEDTATVTFTPTGVPTGTATATLTPTETGTPAGTASATVTPTETGTPAGTASATVTPTQTDAPTPVPTETATDGPSPTPTGTPVPAGQAVAGRAAIVATGLNGIQAVVAAVVTGATGGSGGALVSGGLETPAFPRGAGTCQGCPAQPPGTDCDCCPISGFSTRSCTEIGSPPARTIELALGANACVAAGPAGGSARFNGGVVLASLPGLVNSCDPLLFLDATFNIPELSVEFRDAAMAETLQVDADLDGSVGLTPELVGECLVKELELTLNGSLTSTLPDDTGVHVVFQQTQVVMSDITFNADCVPLAYTLTFNGNAMFLPMSDGLFEVGEFLTRGVVDDDDFAVTFSDFVMRPDATTTPTSVTMSGELSSGCIGGTIGMQTFAPLALAAGQMCPTDGGLNVSAEASAQTATVTYKANGAVDVEQNGMTVSYPSCLTPELLVCS